MIRKEYEEIERAKAMQRCKGYRYFSYHIPQDAIKVTETIDIACLNIKGEKCRVVSRGEKDARKVLSALEIKDLNP